MHPVPWLPRWTILCLTRRMEWSRRVSSATLVDTAKPRIVFGNMDRLSQVIPDELLRLTIEKDHVLDVPVTLSCEIFRIALDPCNVVDEALLSKYFIHQTLNIMARFTINVDIDRPVVRHQIFNSPKSLLQKPQVGFARKSIFISDNPAVASANRCKAIR